LDIKIKDEQEFGSGNVPSNLNRVENDYYAMLKVYFTENSIIYGYQVYSAYDGDVLLGV
jgi:hypothetical protein